MHAFRRPGRLRMWVVFWVIVSIPVPVLGITPKQEEELSREFMKIAIREMAFVQDPLIVDYVNRVGKKIISGMPPQPYDYHFFVIDSDEYNAFAIPAGYVFINSGLLAAMETEDELAGIFGHEIAHVTARHISDRISRSKKINWVALAGLVAGGLLGASGSADVAQAVTQGALAASQSMSLAFSREDERQADQLGLRYIAAAGYSGRGLLTVMRKMRDKQWYDTNLFPDYLSTHPGADERMATIDGWLEQNAGKPVAAVPKRTYEFSRTQARIVAQYGDEDKAVRQFKIAVDKAPQDPIAHYGYGLALARKGRLEQAAVQLRKALEKKAFDPYILNDLGRVYYLGGQYREAMASLEGTVSLSPGNYESLFLMGRTQMELGELAAANDSFEHLVALKPGYPQGNYYLGKTYGSLGRLDQAHFHLGMHYRGKGDLKNAWFHLKTARSLVNDPLQKEEIEKMLQEIGKARKKGKNRKS